MNEYFWNRRKFLGTGVMGLGYAATIEALKSKDKSLYSSSVIRSKFQPRAKALYCFFL